jgi:hypothetical protein
VRWPQAWTGKADRSGACEGPAGRGQAHPGDRGIQGKRLPGAARGLSTAANLGRSPRPHRGIASISTRALARRNVGYRGQGGTDRIAACSEDLEHSKRPGQRRLVSSFMAYRSFWRFWQVWSPDTIRRPLKSHHPLSAIAPVVEAHV